VLELCSWLDPVAPAGTAWGCVCSDIMFGMQANNVLGSAKKGDAAG
jgi:hypothetical protein